MNVVRGLDGIACDPGSVVTVGTFDGVHLAHREIIREVVSRARMKEGRSVVVTFDPHPRQVLGGASTVRLLTTLEERIPLIETLGVDELLVIPFTYEFSRLSSREFYETYVVKGIGVREVIVGYDHMFGRDRQGGIEELVRMGQEYDFSVFAVHPYAVDGETVSSTLIRNALALGDMERARKFLGRPYTLAGRVVKGEQRGRTIGYPTANVNANDELKAVPADGVYLAGVATESGNYFGMMNIGVRPTVAGATRRTIEVHLFDFSGDLYDRNIEITFLQKLRQEMTFASLEELKAQLHRDKEQSLQLIAAHTQRK
ncbi:MAG: bifunctional riboflavin kinase/FAD synthetase [Bacteroidota bacterium]